MKARIKGPAPARVEETRLLEGLFERPERLRERLILAIALAPPRGRRGSSPLRLPPRGK